MDAYDKARIHGSVKRTNKRILNIVAFKLSVYEQDIIDSALTYYFKAKYPTLYEKYNPSVKGDASPEGSPLDTIDMLES